MKLPLPLPLPGPGELGHLITRGTALLDEVLAVGPRVLNLITDIEIVVPRVGGLLDSIENVVARADQAVDRVDAVVGQADAEVARVGEVLDEITPLIGRLQALLDNLEPSLTGLQPVLERLAQTTDPAEIEALIKLVDQLPVVTESLVAAMPVVQTMGNVSDDLHELLLASKQANELLSSFPGAKLLRKLGSDDEPGDER